MHGVGFEIEVAAVTTILEVKSLIYRAKAEISVVAGALFTVDKLNSFEYGDFLNIEDHVSVSEIGIIEGESLSFRNYNDNNMINMGQYNMGWG